MALLSSPLESSRFLTHVCAEGCELPFLPVTLHQGTHCTAGPAQSLLQPTSGRGSWDVRLQLNAGSSAPQDAAQDLMHGPWLPSGHLSESLQTSTRRDPTTWAIAHPRG